VKNLQTLATIGSGSGLIAVAVLALYINAPATTELYSNPLLLWAVCSLLLYWLWHIWALARRGELDEDPVLFALTDRRSQITAAVCGLVILLAM
jgi:hypothetical protein